MTKKIYILLFILAAYFQSIAVTAYPYPVAFTQPNGEQVTLIMKGDEFVKFAETLDGFTLLYNAEGYFCYAQRNMEGGIEPSFFIATDISKRSVEVKQFLMNMQKGIRFSKEQYSMYLQIKDMVNDEYEKNAGDSKGTRRLLAILIGYKDKAFSKTNADFHNLFNQANYTGYSAKGSVYDFFYEASYGKLLMQVDVSGPYTASQNMAYYGANSGGSNDIRPRELMAEAVHLAAPNVNYSHYDNSGDGKVESIYIIFAGFGEEAGGGGNCIWSHAWSLQNPITYNGVQISSYACSPEMRGSSGTAITYIGVICHEFGHSLGAPDYYDTNYETGGSYDGTGRWDLQANGSWNDGGRIPAPPNPRSKVTTYQWATATIINSAQTVTVPSSRLYDNAYYRINTSTNNEYFIIECRKKAGFDNSIPGENMLIFRCASSTQNMNTTSPQKFYPVSANANVALPTTGSSAQSSYGNINSSTCAWPTASKTQFSDTTKPASVSWANVNTNKPITNITAYENYVSFDFMGGGPKANYLVFLPNIVGCKLTPQSGSTSPVATGGNYSFKLDLLTNYEESNVVVKVNGNTITATGGVYSITGITADQLITVEGVQIKTFAITSSAGSNGTISPNGVTAVPIAANQTYTISPSLGYSISSVFVDNVNQGIIETYNFMNVQATHTINASFVEGNEYFFILSTDTLVFETYPGTPSPVAEVIVDSEELAGNVSVVIPTPFQGSTDGAYWLQTVTIARSQLPKTIQLRFNPSVNQPGHFYAQIKVLAKGAYSKIGALGLDKNIGITNYFDDDEIVIYPNPTNGELSIMNYELRITNYELFDIAGKLLLSKQLNESTSKQINLTHLQAGVYFIKLFTENGICVRKIVKQ